MPSSPITMSYCGPPPLPDDLWGRWNFDPTLLGLLALGAGAFFYLSEGHSARQNLALGGSLLTLLVIFVSPLCALTVALFSARVVHHVLLVAVAAPLLAYALVRNRTTPTLNPSPQGGGRPSPLASRRRFYRRPSLEGRAREGLDVAKLLMPALLLHTVTFWLWHAPDAYTAALSSTPIYWLMQVTLLATATLLWGAIIAAPTGRAIVALLFSTIQMGFLGALLVFSGQPLYLPHLTTTLAFGLDPLADQQLAGLIMWVPAALPYLGVALHRLLLWLPRSEARA